MNLKLNQASFNSRIGTLYYIWLRKSQSIRIALLSCSLDSFKKNLYKIKKEYNAFSVDDKKSDAIECMILEYLKGRLKSFNIKPVFLTGSEFEKRIWQATIKIPYSTVTSYKNVASDAGYPKAWRAAGNALNHNPIMLIVPCHRVIKESGEMGEFGAGKRLKKLLLGIEQAI